MTLVAGGAHRFTEAALDVGDELAAHRGAAHQPIVGVHGDGDAELKERVEGMLGERVTPLRDPAARDRH